MAGNFVGRREFLRRILAANAEPGRQSRLFVIQGIPGSGKTELLNQLRRAVERREGSVAGAVISIQGVDYEAARSRRDARSADDPAELRQFKTLLQECLPDVVEGAVSGTHDWTELKPSFGGAAHAGKVTGSDADELIGRATEALTLLARDLAPRHERVLVLVDDFHLIAPPPLGDWVLRWLVGIRGADIVVTHIPAAEQAPPWPSHAVVLQLGNLGRDDVQRYLAATENIGPDVAAEIVEPVWEFTGGNPQALVLVVDLVRESSKPGDAVQALRQVAAIEGELREKLGEVVERIFRATHDAELRHALYSLCVTRYFDTDLIVRLLGVDKAHAVTLVDQMRQFSFVTDGRISGFLTISPYVRNLGETKHTDGAQRAEIHAASAEYFHGLLLEEFDEDESWAAAWYRLENEIFQIHKKEWLYHVSRLTGARRRTGRLGIARLFLDGFWWWGCYAPFPFCEEILADWMVGAATDTSQESREDLEWGQALQGIYDAYPRGNRLEQATRPQLITVRRYLRQLWDRGALDNQQDNADGRHLRGIVSVFLADVLRYLNPADPAVDEKLADAAAILGEDDEYFLAWIDFQRDDLLLQREQWAEAMTLSRQAAQRHARFDDRELIANFHRVYADALWGLKEPGQALDGYARAVLHAYAMQVRTGPDPYTNAFQQEMIDRCTERLVALRAVGDDAAREVLNDGSARIRAFFSEYWDALGQDEEDVAAAVAQALADEVPAKAASLLFPALAPEVDSDLTRVGTAWELIGHDVLGEMQGELNALPGTPLPPPAPRSPLA